MNRVSNVAAAGRVVDRDTGALKKVNCAANTGLQLFAEHTGRGPFWAVLSVFTKILAAVPIHSLHADRLYHRVTP
jgi:hypothetical protein